MILYHEQSPIHAECSLLACAVLDPNCFHQIREAVTSLEVFTDPNNRACFKAMDQVFTEYGIAEPSLVMDALHPFGDNLVGYYAGLCKHSPTSANLQTFREAVIRAYKRRCIAAGSKELATYADRQTATAEAMNERVQTLVEILADDARGDIDIPDAQVATKAAENLIQKAERGGVVGLHSGFKAYDKMLSGLRPGMHVVAARPSVGKTAFALNIAHHVCKNEGAVLFITLEMSKEDLAERMLMMIGGINEERLSGGFLRKVETGKITAAAAEYEKMKFTIRHPGMLTPSKMRAIVANEVIKCKPDLVMIDYIQLMQGDKRSDNRQTEVAEVSRSIKLLAQEFGVPVMALSQVSRDADDEAPKMRHLRESGAIEQDADTVLMLHRDNAKPSELLCLLRKQRKGPTGDFTLYFDKPTQRMYETGSAPVPEPSPPREPAPPMEDIYDDGDEVPF